MYISFAGDLRSYWYAVFIYEKIILYVTTKKNYGVITDILL